MNEKEKRAAWLRGAQHQLGNRVNEVTRIIFGLPQQDQNSLPSSSVPEEEIVGESPPTDIVPGQIIFSASDKTDEDNPNGKIAGLKNWAEKNKKILQWTAIAGGFTVIIIGEEIYRHSRKGSENK